MVASTLWRNRGAHDLAEHDSAMVRPGAGRDRRRLIGYAIIYLAVLVILHLFGDPAPRIVSDAVAHFCAATASAGVAIVLAETIAPTGRHLVIKWAGGVLLVMAGTLAATGVALQEAPIVAAAAGFVVGVFLGWAVEKRWG